MYIKKNENKIPSFLIKNKLKSCSKFKTLWCKTKTQPTKCHNFNNSFEIQFRKYFILIIFVQHFLYKLLKFHLILSDLIWVFSFVAMILVLVHEHFMFITAYYTFYYNGNEQQLMFAGNVIINLFRIIYMWYHFEVS